jgi:hypothetical protein
MWMVVRLVQPLNVETPRDGNVEVPVNVTVVRAVQPANAESPMLVTVSGIVTEVISTLF